MARDYDAIVIGTSAGGLQTLTMLLGDLPPDYPLPIVIVQHRSRDQRNLMEEVLQTKCRIRIRQAEEKEKVNAGTVYIAPPDYHLLIEKDITFSLSSDEYVRYSRPAIDVLFESAARAYRNRLVAVVLTGSSDDGSAGVRTVKELGGFTIAQKPEEALFSIMPAAAIRTGKVDKIMDIASIKSFMLTLSTEKP